MRVELDEFQERLEEKPQEEVKKIELQNSSFVDMLRNMLEDDRKKANDPEHLKKKKREIFG